MASSSLKSYFFLPVKWIVFLWISSAHFHRNITSELEQVIKSWMKFVKRLICLLIILLPWTITTNHPLRGELQCHLQLRHLTSPHFTPGEVNTVFVRMWRRAVFLCVCPRTVFYSRRCNPDRCLTTFQNAALNEQFSLNCVLRPPSGKIKKKSMGEAQFYTLSRPILHQLPVVDVVVLPSPAPVLVGEAVDLQKLFFTEAWNSSKVSGVRQPAGVARGREGKGGKGEKGEDIIWGHWTLKSYKTSRTNISTISAFHVFYSSDSVCQKSEL